MDSRFGESCFVIIYANINKYFCPDIAQIIINYDNRKRVNRWLDADYLRGYYNYQMEECRDVKRAFYGASRAGHIELINLLRPCGKCDLRDALHEAIAGGQIVAMQLLISYGALDVDAEDPILLDRVVEAFSWATICGQIEAMKLLKSHGAEDFDNALCEAGRCGQVEAITLLKSYGATDFNQALCEASMNGEIEAMKRLKSYGAEDFNNALYYARRFQAKIEAVELIQSWMNETEN